MTPRVETGINVTAENDRRVVEPASHLSPRETVDVLRDIVCKRAVRAVYCRQRGGRDCSKMY